MSPLAISVRWLAAFLISLPHLVSAGEGEGAVARADLRVRNVWVQVVPPGRGILRAITEGRHCPVAKFTRRRKVKSPGGKTAQGRKYSTRMKVRARPNSDYDVLVCELPIPRDTRRIHVAGRDLRPVSPNPQRIAVVGDTGCRMKDGSAFDDGFQNCGDPDDWEFARVAQRVAEWQPDLIIQLGDYIYREEPCPDGCGNCQGSPFNSPGMRMDTWNLEFFDPARPMLEAAPIVLVRGDHEKCERAGIGYFRFLDPFDLRACTDFSDPYALDFDDLQLVVMDTAQADDTTLSPEVVIDRYARDFDRVAQLATGNTWLMSHRPIWALRPTGDASEKDVCLNQSVPPDEVEIINATAQDALASSRLAGRLPPAVGVVLTGHIHVGEVLSFTGGRPPQMVVGISGTKLLPAVTSGLVNQVIDGETVTHALMVSEHGFFGFVPSPPDAWRVDIFNVGGSSISSCRLADGTADCR